VRHALPVLFLFLNSGVGLLAQQPAPPSAAPAQVAEVLTLEQAIQIAQANNRTIRNAFLNTQMDDDKMAGAAPGVLPSEVLKAAMPKLMEVMKSLPPGYQIVIGGEMAKQVSGFRDLAVVMLVSISAIFLSLVLQFNHAVKPLLVYAAVPYGIVGALIALAVMGTPFGFMAFLAVASLIGVIVSHVIVLFDFIEEMHEKGEPLQRALVDAGIVRLRPVLITVGATVLALFPLALHGGPLWKPLCYSQIGGLCAATFITLLLVPVLYSIFVLDLKIVKWEAIAPHEEK
jgi:multidrug efflux pump